jgi:hypothetical protein
VIGSIGKLESAQVAASLKRKLLLPVPQSPRTAKDSILPVRAVSERFGEGLEIRFSTDELVRAYWKVRLWQHGIVILTKLTILNVEVCEFC